MLKYPNDRHNGFILVDYASDKPYMLHLKRWEDMRFCSQLQADLNYCRAFLVLAKRLDNKKERTR